MEMMKQGIIDTISDTENTVEELVGSITAGKLEVLQYYANHIDMGYINCESTNWAALMYYPSPVMPMKKMSRVTYWYTYQDLYMSVLDRLTDCLQTIEFEQCRCGFSVIDFHGHSMQCHQEFINPDGSMKENAVAELQKIEPNKKSTILQETSDTPIDKSKKESHGEEHNRAVEPEQKVRSDRWEVPSQAKPHLRVATWKLQLPTRKVKIWEIHLLRMKTMMT